MVNVKKLSLSYDSDEIVLKDLSLSVNKGECILFTGRSGSGKSSIINSINGLATRYDGATVEGEITIAGKDIKNLELYEISMLVSSVFQNPKTHFFNVNTTIELLSYLENIGLSREEMDVRMTDMLNLFPIKHLLDRDIFMLSGGEKQILSIAAAYISGTNIIVLDEPSSNLDGDNIQVVSDMLAKLKNKGITILICEHRIFYLMDIVDRIFLIQDGTIASEYNREEFLKLDKQTLHALGLRDQFKTELTVPEIIPENVSSSTYQGTLEIRDIDFQLGVTGKRLQLHNIRLEVGKIYGIIGTNGLGKSTFTKCLIGVEPKCNDEIYLNGKKLSKNDRLKRSSLVMQDVNHQLFTDSVTNEIRLGINGLEDSKVNEVLEKLDLTDLSERHPMSLSGGQKQRVAIASVVCKDAQLMFFDEPTSGMDYANMVRISQLIQSCKRADKIIFIVSHDVEFLNITADNILDMKKFQ